MAGLDVDKKQAYQQQIMARAAENKAMHLDVIYRERILPKMEFIRAGLVDLCAELEQSESAIRANYFIEGLGRLDNLIQSDYQVNANNSVETNQVIFKYGCYAEGELNVYIEGKKNVDMYISLLTENKLKFKGKMNKDSSGFISGAKFIIDRYVPISFTFKVDIQNALIDLSVRNYESLGETHVQFSPESITDDFMKNLAEYVKRKNRHFFGFDLTEIERRRIRAKVLYEQQQRAAELEAADKRGANNEPRKKGFFSRLMGL